MLLLLLTYAAAAAALTSGVYELPPDARLDLRVAEHCVRGTVEWSESERPVKLDLFGLCDDCASADNATLTAMLTSPTPQPRLEQLFLQQDGASMHVTHVIAAILLPPYDDACVRAMHYVGLLAATDRSLPNIESNNVFY